MRARSRWTRGLMDLAGILAYEKIQIVKPRAPLSPGRKKCMRGLGASVIRQRSSPPPPVTATGATGAVGGWGR